MHATTEASPEVAGGRPAPFSREVLERELNPAQLEAVLHPAGPLLVVAGEVFDGCGHRVPTVSLTERFGPEEARANTVACVETVVAEWLQRLDLKRA